MCVISVECCLSVFIYIFLGVSHKVVGAPGCCGQGGMLFVKDWRLGGILMKSEVLILYK